MIERKAAPTNTIYLQGVSGLLFYQLMFYFAF